MRGTRFSRSLSAEWRKLTATKMWWIMALVMFLYSAMMAGTFAAMFGAMAGDGAGVGPLSDAVAAQMIYSSTASFGYAVPLLFGAIAATSEIRHKVLSLAFIAEPRREIVLFSKLTVLLGAGLLLGIAGLLASMGVGGAVFYLLGGDPSLGASSTWSIVVRILAVVALWALIGFGLGRLLSNQAITIVVALVFTQFLEPILRMGAMFWDWLDRVAQFLPGAVTDAFIGVSLLGDMSALDPSVPESSGGLSIWQGGIVLLLYAVLAVALAWVLRWQKDVQ